MTLTRMEAARLAALKRRRDRLVERLKAWDRGDPSRTRQELSALRWAIRIIEVADQQGMIEDLKELGYLQR